MHMDVLHNEFHFIVLFIYSSFFTLYEGKFNYRICAVEFVNLTWNSINCYLVQSLSDAFFFYYESAKEFITFI